MKRLFLAILIVLFCIGTSFALDWHTTNQATVQWDAVTTYVDGTTISEGTVSYELFLINATETDKTKAVSIGTTVDTFKIITLDQKGEYYVGVKAMLTTDEKVSESTVSWSDAFGWGIRFYPALAAPGNFQPQ